MKLEAPRLRALIAGTTAAATFAAGCSLVLGDLPPTRDEQTASGAGGASAGGSAARGGAGGTAQTGGAGGTVSTGGSGGGSSGTSGMPGCDEDGDDFVSEACGGDDCNDMNDAVNPDQTTAYPEPHDVGGSFDYDCNGTSEREGPFVTCGLIPSECPTGTEGFLDSSVPCGETGPWGACVLVNMGLSCAEEVRSTSRVMACR